MDGLSLSHHRRECIGQSREDYSSTGSQGAVWPQPEHALQPDGSGGVSLPDSARSALSRLGGVRNQCLDCRTDQCKPKGWPEQQVNGCVREAHEVRTGNMHGERNKKQPRPDMGRCRPSPCHSGGLSGGMRSLARPGVGSGLSALESPAGVLLAGGWDSGGGWGDFRDYKSK